MPKQRLRKMHGGEVITYSLILIRQRQTLMTSIILILVRSGGEQHKSGQFHFYRLRRSS